MLFSPNQLRKQHESTIRRFDEETQRQKSRMEQEFFAPVAKKHEEARARRMEKALGGGSSDDGAFYSIRQCKG